MGNVAIHVKRLDKEAEELSALDVARAEAHAIDNCYKGGPVPDGRKLRIHISGDSRTQAGTRIINSAVGRWIKRGGEFAFSYTHAWEQVPNELWSNVSILASIENTSQVNKARDKGYAPAIVVPEHNGAKAYQIQGSDTKFIPCPAQTKDNVDCIKCGLCFDADRLYNKNMGISFAVHGVKKNELKRRLTVLK